MKNKVTAFKPTDGIKAKAHRKENHFTDEYAILVPSDYPNRMRNAVTLRIYATDRMAYSCVWISNDPNYASGSGSAGGYGYHRSSAAVADALTSAGIELEHSISGVGSSAIEEALTAIAEHLQLKDWYLHHANA